MSRIREVTGKRDHWADLLLGKLNTISGDSWTDSFLGVAVSIQMIDRPI